MSDHRWRRDPMGRPYDPYRGFDERGRNIPDDSGYDRASNRRGAADPGYRPDAYDQRDHATDQYRAHDRGQLGGGWEWQRARRGEVEGDYGRGYGNRDNGPYRDTRDRGFVDRAADEVASWFGDEQAERRRHMDDYDRGGRHRYDQHHDDRHQQDRARRDRNWSGW